MLRLPAEKIKEAILHPDQEVRNAAVNYFANSFSHDPAIMPLVLQAFDRYGLDAFTNYWFLLRLAQTGETIAWIIREIERIGLGTGEQEERYASSLQRALRSGNPDSLRQHSEVIQAMRHLDHSSRQVIADRIAVDSRPPNELWTELTQFCKEHEDDSELNDKAYQHCASLVSSLAEDRDQFEHQVLDHLKKPDGWLEVFLVRLAGEMKLEAATALLADRLEDAETFACEEAHTALERIGTDAVVRELARRYIDGDWDIRLSVAGILETIHTDRSVQTCLEFLEREQDEMLRGMLLEAVLMNFCPLGIEPARRHILKTPKNPELLEVRSALLVACKLLGETFPEFEAWQEDSKHDVEFRRQAYQERYLGQNLANLDEDASADTGLEDEDEQAPEILRRGQRIGRNDPCPCGSGKKFKKCCYGKTKVAEETDAGHAEAMSGLRSDTKKYPIGTIALYGPDDHTTTKIVAAVIKRENSEPILERWVGTGIGNNPKVQRQMNAFFDRHHVKSVVAAEGNLGCPHEEGMDFPEGEDCPFCPYWAGKQGSARRDD